MIATKSKTAHWACGSRRRWGNNDYATIGAPFGDGNVNTLRVPCCVTTIWVVVANTAFNPRIEAPITSVRLATVSCRYYNGNSTIAAPKLNNFLSTLGVPRYVTAV